MFTYICPWFLVVESQSPGPAQVSPIDRSVVRPIERGTLIFQHKYKHPTKAGRTRYGAPPDRSLNTVEFYSTQLDTNTIFAGARLQTASKGHIMEVLLDPNATVLEHQGVNITVHLSVRTSIFSWDNSDFVCVLVCILTWRNRCQDTISTRTRCAQRLGENHPSQFPVANLLSALQR